MNIKSFLKLTLVCLPILSLSNGYSQTQHSEEVNIIGSFKPKISKADKMNFYPKINNEIIQMPQLRYDFKSMIYESWFDLEPVKPARVGKEQMPLLMRNYIKAGYGNKNTPFVDFYAGSLQHKDYSFGAHIKHFSSDGNIEDYANSAFSKNEVSLFGRRIFKTHQLSAHSFYNRNVVHKYGFKPLEIPSGGINLDPEKQRFQEAGLNISLKSNYLDESVIYHAFGLSYTYYGDINKMVENRLKFTANLNQQIRSDASNQLSIGLNLKVDYFNSSFESIDNEDLYTYVNPFIRADFDEYYVQLGLNTIFKTDTVTTNYLYPNVEAGIFIIPNVLSAKIGIRGDYDRNSFSTLSKINPYVNSNIALKDFNNEFEAYVHIEGKLAEKLDLSIGISQSSIENYPLFVNDTSSILQNSFEVVYDEVDVLTANISLSFEAKETVHLLFVLNYYNYTLKNELRAWHKPEFSVSFAGHFSITDQFMLKTKIQTNGKSYAKTYENDLMVVKELKPYFNLNLEMEYFYTNHMSFFLSFNNITSSDYRKWNDYPNQKLTIIGGLSYAF